LKYRNAAEVLPINLLNEIQKHISGELLYIPTGENHVKWGEKNGSMQYYKDRNKNIKEMYDSGYTMEKIGIEFGLSLESVRKIIYKA
jgi:hypothetical protein